MIQATVDASALKARLNGTASKVFANVRATVETQTGLLASYIKSSKLSGQILKNRTGNLRNSVFNNVTSSGELITGTVGVDNTAPYGAFQEYGAHIPERVPVNAKALRWYVGGSPIFRMRARAFDLPPRPFMGPSLQERREEIVAAIQASVNRSVSE